MVHLCRRLMFLLFLGMMHTFLFFYKWSFFHIYMSVLWCFNVVLVMFYNSHYYLYSRLSIYKQLYNVNAQCCTIIFAWKNLVLVKSQNNRCYDMILNETLLIALTPKIYIIFHELLNVSYFEVWKYYLILTCLNYCNCC